VAGDDGQRRLATSSVDHDEGEESAAEGLQLASVDACLPRVGVEAAADPPPPVELGENAAPARAREAKLTLRAIEASTAARPQPRLSGFHVLEQIDSSASEPPVLGARQ